MEFASGNVFIRPMSFAKAGDVVDGHSHNFDHTTYVVRGAAHFESLNADGSVRGQVDKSAGEWVLIKAGVIHRITALQPDSLAHCIYAHRNPQGEVVQEYTGWEDAST